jgi:hypothetical protein
VRDFWIALPPAWVLKVESEQTYRSKVFCCFRLEPGLPQASIKVVGFGLIRTGFGRLDCGLPDPQIIVVAC